MLVEEAGHRHLIVGGLALGVPDAVKLPQMLRGVACAAACQRASVAVRPMKTSLATCKSVGSLARVLVSHHIKVFSDP